MEITLSGRGAMGLCRFFVTRLAYRNEDVLWRCPDVDPIDDGMRANLRSLEKLIAFILDTKAELL